MADVRYYKGPLLYPIMVDHSEKEGVYYMKDNNKITKSYFDTSDALFFINNNRWKEISLEEAHKIISKLNNNGKDKKTDSNQRRGS